LPFGRCGLTDVEVHNADRNDKFEFEVRSILKCRRDGEGMDGEGQIFEPEPEKAPNLVGTMFMNMRAIIEKIGKIL
jgi:hypothetical protein